MASTLFHCDVIPADHVRVNPEATAVSVSVKTTVRGGPDYVCLTPAEARRMAHLLLSWAEKKEPTPRPSKPSYMSLTQQGQLILQHIRRAGSISAREAMDDYGITSATLARRICDIEQAGYDLTRKRKVHPITGKSYTRYSVVEAP